MIKVYNARPQTFRFEAKDGTSTVVKPLAFAEIEEKYTEDPLYRLAINAKALQPFNTVKQGDEIEKAAHASKNAKTRVKKDDAE